MEKNKVKKSLRVSFLDGIFAACMNGLTGDYVVPYALALRATASQVGILSASVSLASSLVQLKSADLSEWLSSRKKIINFSVFFHIVTLLPVIFIPYLFKFHQIPILIILITLTSSISAFAAPAWASLMSEYIPVRKRGEYFGWRNKIMMAITVAAAFTSGVILYFFKHDALKGFAIIFFIAVACRCASWYFVTKMHEPPFKFNKESYFSFLDFVLRMRESNFARFVIFAASMQFCVNLASPFFSVFMLRDLKFSYLTYTVLITAVSLAQILTINRWGRHADRVGNVKVMKFTSLLIASLPLWWIPWQNPFYLVFAQVLSGFAWAGFNLCAVNFIYDAVTPQKRVRCIAYFNVFVGVATCMGALCGALLINVLPRIFNYRILSLFLLASLCRFIAVFTLSGKIKEVRHIEDISSRNLFYSVIGLKPFFGPDRDPRQNLGSEG